MSEPVVDDLPITVQLSLWRWRLVIGNLQRGIFAEVAPLISAIAAQAEQQLAVAAAEAWARKFFENWREQLKWQRLKPYEHFAAMIERHWDGIAAYCKPENKVALGFVEGLNNKIRVLQRRAYGLRDEEYLRLKVLTCMLPQL
jgi:Transposase